MNKTEDFINDMARWIAITIKEMEDKTKGADNK